MYKCIEFKHVLFASTQSTGFHYNCKLVKGVFLHSLYQGINEKYLYIRRDLKPYIPGLSVTDDFMELIARGVSENTERQKKGQVHKQKIVIVSTVQQDRDR